MEKLEVLVDSFENKVFDQYAEHIHKYRKCDLSIANEEARKYIGDKWDTLENKLMLVSGKTMLKEINKWMRQEYGIASTVNKILNTFTVGDVCEEVKQILFTLVSGLEVN